MAHAQQPAIQRPRAVPGCHAAQQVVIVPQVEPPPLTEPAPLPGKNSNPPPGQL